MRGFSSHNAFTLVEILVVLGIVVLGWLWLPGLITPNSTASPSLSQLLSSHTARTRLEAIARGHPVGLAISALQAPQTLTIGYEKEGAFVKILETTLPPGITLDKELSRITASDNFLVFTNWDGPFYAVWWYDTQGRPVKKSPTLAFTDVKNTLHSYTISNEGALLPLN